MNQLMAKEQFGGWEGSVPVNLSSSIKSFIAFTLFIFFFAVVALVKAPGMDGSFMLMAGFSTGLTLHSYEMSRWVNLYQKGVVIPAKALGGTKLVQQYVIEYATVTGLVLEETAIVLKRKEDQYRILKEQFTEERFEKLKKKLSEKLSDKVQS